MRLVIDGQRLTATRTGVGRCLESLLVDWAESGWPLDEVVLVVRDMSGLARFPNLPALKAVAVGPGWPGLLWENLGLGRVLRPDDVLFAPANLIPWTWRGRTLAILYDTLPWSVPMSFPWHIRLRFGWRYRQAARRATHIVVPSRATASDVMRVHGVRDDRISVVYPAPEPRFRPLRADASEVRNARESLGLGDGPFFLFVGKRSKRRNVGAILDAFSRHRDRFPDHRLVFVGPDGGEGLAGVGSGIVAAGHVAEDVLHGLLASALALIYPSDYEGFGLPVVEAQACGCPVVTLRNSALTESGGDAAYYLDSADPDSIARAFEILASDHAVRSDFVARGLENVKRFSRSLFADGVKREIRRVAATA